MRERFHFNKVFFDQPQQYGAVRLMQIGDLYCETEYQIPSHRQTCHEISYIVAGSGVFTRNSRPFEVSEGDLFLSPEGSEHSITSSRTDALRYFFCAFTLDRDHADYCHYRGLEALFNRSGSPVANDRYALTNIFAMLFNEVQNDYANKEILMAAGLNQLLLLTQRDFSADGRGETVWLGQENSSKKKLVYDVVRYVDDHIFHIRRLNDLGDVFGYSYSYITQAFSAVMGISLNQYFRHGRMRKAAELLDNAISVTRVADIMGFDSLQSFSRSFKSFYGVPPTQYRKK